MKDIFQVVFPGMMLMWVCFIANGVFADIFEEYKAHTVSRLVSSGVTLGQVLLSKIVRCLVVCWICELLLILFTAIVFGVGWRHPLMLFVILTSFNVFLMGLLSLIYGYARSTELANAIIVFVLLIAAVLGGSFMPFDQLPRVLQAVGRWTMIRMANYGIDSLFQSRPLWESLRPSFLLAVAGTALVAAGTMVLRKRFESGGGA
ncbi:MAG: ABC transporter permease [Sedimentisphaerales bacterium]|nr:ABC transporter permease [Sedimentisphaerales bacterium]